MVLALGRVGLWACLYVFFIAVAVAPAMERHCLPIYLAAATLLDHETTDAAVVLPLLLIEDPYHQVNPHAPFPLALSDWHVNERVKAVHRVLEAHNDRVKIVLDEWNTWVLEYSKNPEYFSAAEIASPARIILVLKHPLDENPELLFQGVVTQLLFDRLPLMKGNYRRAFDEGSARLLAAVKAAAAENEPLRKSLASMTDEEINEQIHETVKLRITWILKVKFYAWHAHRHPELLEARIENPRHNTVLETLAKLDEEPLGQSASFDDVMRDEFTRFYAQSISQPLDPEIIRAVWPIPLSGLWESSLVFPDLLYPELETHT